jgi:cyclopropane fatty-acyl-phospholipid synthase-like methyltransferase
MNGKRWTVERVRSESSYWRSCVLLTAAHLDLFAWIGNQDRKPSALAAHFGGDAKGWEIFLNALCGLGLLHKRDKKYRNTIFAARHLGHGTAARLWPGHDDLREWIALSSALVTGKRPNIPKPFFSDQRQTKRLLNSLDLDAREIAPYLLKKLPLKKARSLLDVGGGLGSYSIAFCQCYSNLEATVIEHPKIAPLTRRAIHEANMAQRIQVIGIDIFRQSLPQGFDAVFLSNVLHAQGARENRSLFSKLHRCLNPKGQLILRDVFLNRDGTGPEWGTLFSVLLFLNTPRGRCYRLDDILQWLREAGFSRVKGPFRSSSLSFDPDSVLVAGA